MLCWVMIENQKEREKGRLREGLCKVTLRKGEGSKKGADQAKSTASMDTRSRSPPCFMIR